MSYNLEISCNRCGENILTMQGAQSSALFETIECSDTFSDAVYDENICETCAQKDPKYRLSKNIVENILRDLSDRRGIRHELEAIASDVYQEMESELIRMTMTVIATDEENKDA